MLPPYHPTPICQRGGGTALPDILCQRRDPGAACFDHLGGGGGVERPSVRELQICSQGFVKMAGEKPPPPWSPLPNSSAKLSLVLRVPHAKLARFRLTELGFQAPLGGRGGIQWRGGKFRTQINSVAWPRGQGTSEKGAPSTAPTEGPGRGLATLEAGGARLPPPTGKRVGEGGSFSLGGSPLQGRALFAPLRSCAPHSPAAPRRPPRRRPSTGSCKRRGGGS